MPHPRVVHQHVAAVPVLGQDALGQGLALGLFRHIEHGQPCLTALFFDLAGRTKPRAAEVAQFQAEEREFQGKSEAARLTFVWLVPRLAVPVSRAIARPVPAYPRLCRAG